MAGFITMHHCRYGIGQIAMVSGRDLTVVEEDIKKKTHLHLSGPWMRVDWVYDRSRCLKMREK
jgi:hypothetical protein